MRQVCVRAFSGHRPGDAVEVPDGAAVSPLYFAAEGTPEAEAAIAQAARLAGEMQAAAAAAEGGAQ